ncbi:integrase [Lachnospiraceae bacterium PM6-15]|uniref:tyrosine-type recombinase/integrase n=1 Tax=Ohessyouella blattaphilus TaxID=2949333 RepID=UPI003E1C82C9
MLNNYREEISNDEMLNCALECANMNVDDVRNKIQMTRRQNIIRSHPYTISQGSDGRWRTYVFDETRKHKRRQIVRTTYEALCDDVYENAMEHGDGQIENKIKESNLTFQEFYYVWLNYKNAKTKRGTTIKKINSDFKRYFLENEISKPYLNKRICDFKYVDLDEWMHKLCLQMEMTATQYYNMSLIPRQMFEYATDKEDIDSNPFARVKIDSKQFKRKAKPADETQVFYEDEIMAVNKASIDYYNAHNEHVMSLILPLLFQTGLRLGEIIALEFADIDDEFIYVHQMQVSDYELVNGKIISKGCVIVDSLKQNAVARNVHLTEEALNYIEMLKKHFARLGLEPKYLFEDIDGTLPNNSTVDRHIRRICKLAGIDEKSAHKTRKTFISRLLDSQQVSLNYIREQVGHNDERTTLHNYGFNSRRTNETHKKAETVLQSGWFLQNVKQC